MKLEEVIKLLDAGYSKDEIQALNGSDTVEPEPAADPEPTTAPDPEEDEPAPAPAPEPADKTLDIVNALAQQVASLTKTIQRSNLLYSQQPAQETDTAERILANIINPTYKKKED